MKLKKKQDTLAVSGFPGSKKAEKTRIFKQKKDSVPIENPAGCLMTGLRGPQLTDEEREFLISEKGAGVILFRRNIVSLKQTFELCREIKRLSPELPPLIAVDLEGGRVNRFSHLKEMFPWPAPEKLGRLKPSEIFSTAEIMGRELSALGIDINFAPVVDLPQKKSDLLKGRVFSRNKKTLALCSRAFTNGMMKGGVLPCLKHFPGHGGVSEDSHHTLPRDESSLRSMKAQFDLFEKLYRSHLSFQDSEKGKKPGKSNTVNIKHLPLIMTAHVQFQNIDAVPATFSGKFLREILREKMRFRGVIVSDDIDMEALSSFSPAERFSKAISGGCNLILSCQRPETPREILQFFSDKPESLNSIKESLKISQALLTRLRQERAKSPAPDWPAVQEILFCPKDRKYLHSLTPFSSS